MIAMCIGGALGGLLCIFLTSLANAKPPFRWWLSPWSDFTDPQDRLLRRTWNAVSPIYSDEERHYHNIEHITEGFEILERYFAKHDSTHRVTVLLAWMFHDIVMSYDQSDEYNSATYAEFFSNVEPNLPWNDDVYHLIMATKRNGDHQAPQELADLLMDVDIVRLGCKQYEDFYQYSQDIFNEVMAIAPGKLEPINRYSNDYYEVAKRTFTQRRCEFLKRMLDDKPIFQTKWFRDRYEYQADINITRYCYNNMNVNA
jgi:predicted metal-dependent HD superfamily phosphohydrolase